jgi:hypothetical protein
MRRLLAILALVASATAVAEELVVPKWIDDARVARAELKKSHAALFQEVSAILYRLDPIGIGARIGSPSDEYDAEAGTIIPRLGACQSARDVQTVVFEEFVRWFGDDIAGKPDLYEEEGTRIWKAWPRYRNGLPSNTPLERTRDR